MLPGVESRFLLLVFGKSWLYWLGHAIPSLVELLRHYSHHAGNLPITLSLTLAPDSSYDYTFLDRSCQSHRPLNTFLFIENCSRIKYLTLRNAMPAWLTYVPKLPGLQSFHLDEESQDSVARQELFKLETWGFSQLQLKSLSFSNISAYNIIFFGAIGSQVAALHLGESFHFPRMMRFLWSHLTGQLNASVLNNIELPALRDLHWGGRVSSPDRSTELRHLAFLDRLPKSAQSLTFIMIPCCTLDELEILFAAPFVNQLRTVSICSGPPHIYPILVQLLTPSWTTSDGVLYEPKRQSLELLRPYTTTPPNNMASLVADMLKRRRANLTAPDSPRFHFHLKLEDVYVNFSPRVRETLRNWWRVDYGWKR
ncbi:hypothetical protein NP233_g3257 [Leucocoprinus birnbaumii]|uniref:Uncharacterized protein n=1 Tax=Leucocoprinus birnbaumii TaxID=56174 RepID=A0AAD5VWT9_9AGAR|nr:hypothetical protein NP233_g3257 [Leucocoprinus birnbaumii]